MATNGRADVFLNGNHLLDAHIMDVTPTANDDMYETIHLSIRQTEILRCFAQYLLEKSYKETYDKLVSESAVVLENHNVAKLRASVLSGNWMEAEDALSNLKYEVNSEENLRQMKFLILEQQILEAMEDKDFLHGVGLLRERLTPMNLNRDRVHHLATCLMYEEISELHNMASWKGKTGGSREVLVDKLQGFIPAQVMLPPKRLEALFNMAIEYQIKNCAYHNTEIHLIEQSLLQNHDCGKKNFPTTIVQDLKINQSELCVCKFSPNGQYLAVGGKSPTLDIFSVNSNTLTISKFIDLQCGGNGCVNFLSWSSDSRKVAVCLSEDQGPVLVFEIPTGKCICTVRINEDEPYNCSAFFPDNQKLAIGSLKGVIYIVDTADQGKSLVTVDGYRAQSMVAFQRDSVSYDSLLVADSHRRIREFQFGYDSSTNGYNSSNISSAMETAATVPGMIGGFASTIFGLNNNPSILPTRAQFLRMCRYQHWQSSDVTEPIAMVPNPTHSSTSITGTMLGPLMDINMAAAYAINVSSHSAPTSASTSSESISVPQSTNTTATTAVSTTLSTSLNPLVMHHAFSTPGITNPMLQWVSNSAISSTSTSSWIRNTLPLVTSSIDNVISNLNSTSMSSSNVTSVPTASSNTVTASATTTAFNINSNNNRLPYSKIHDETLFETDTAIQSIVLSKLKDKLITFLNKLGICMWHLPSKQILQRFLGLEPKKCILHPTFGGYNEDFIGCGSENGYLHIWHHASNTPVHQVLLMADINVGCVHWNPNNVKMIACVNDAGHLFIIGPAQYGIKD